VAASFYLFDVFLRLSTDVVTDDLQRDFGVGKDAVASAFGASFFYAYAAVQLLVGVFLDKAGPRATICVCALLAGGGAVVFGFAPTVAVGTIGRVLSGIGSGAGWLGAVKVVRNSFGADGRTSDLMFGVTCMLGGVGGLASQAPLRLLVQAIGWRSAFKVVGAGVGGAISVLALVCITDAPLAAASAGAAVAPNGSAGGEVPRDIDGAPADAHGAALDSHEPPAELVAVAGPGVGGPGETGRAHALVATLRVLKSVATTPRMWLYTLYLGCTDAPFETFAGLTGVSYLEEAVGGSVGAAAATLTMVCVIVATTFQLLGGPLINFAAKTYRARMLLLIAFALVGALGFVPALLPLFFASGGGGAAHAYSPPDSMVLWAASVSAVGVSVGSCTVIWHVISSDALCNGSDATGIVAGAVNTFVIALDAVTQSVFGLLLGGGASAGAGGNSTAAAWETSAGAGAGGERVYDAHTYARGFALLFALFIVAALAAAAALVLRALRTAKAKALPPSAPYVVL
jgi:hypothetical protein